MGDACAWHGLATCVWCVYAAKSTLSMRAIAEGDGLRHSLIQSAKVAARALRSPAMPAEVKGKRLDVDAIACGGELGVAVAAGVLVRAVEDE